MSDKIFETLDVKIEKTVARLKEDLITVRAGKANAAMVDKVMVKYYDVPTPLKQLANVSVPDPRTIAITPFDSSIIKEVEHGINEANLGITPSNDGKVIRLTIPQVTEDRRKEISKDVKKIGEEAKVAIRNIRRDMTDELKKIEKADNLPEDAVKDNQDKIQKITDKYVKIIDEHAAEKEKEVMTV